VNETSLFLHPEIANRNDSFLKVCLSFFKHDKKKNDAESEQGFIFFFRDVGL